MSRVLKAVRLWLLCGYEQGLEGACVSKVDGESFRQQQAQVEAIARSVSALGEEVRTRDAQMLELKCVLLFD